MIANVLSIAGSDPSGGAGIQADLKTFGALGCYGMAVVTALTVQNTQGVSAVHVPPTDIITGQIEAILADVNVAAIKIGLLPSAEAVEAVAGAVQKAACPVVLDPVLVATSGDALSKDDVPFALIKHLFARADLVTPNVSEAATLAGEPLPTDLATVRLLAPTLLEKGTRAILLKGGDLAGATSDDLFYDASGETLFSAPRIRIGKSGHDKSGHDKTHGTGCTLSSAIACYLAQGLSMTEAIRAAKAYLTQALAHAHELDVGHGARPLQHFHTR